MSKTIMNKKILKMALSLLSEIEVSLDAEGLFLPIVEIKTGNIRKQLWVSCVRATKKITGPSAGKRNEGRKARRI